MEEKTKKKKMTTEDHAFWRAVGRRKQAVARVRLMEGNGLITINGKNFDVYFPQSIEQQLIQVPLVLVDKRTTYDVSVKVEGGGFRGQAEAVRHGISRALLAIDPELKKTLRGEGLLTRDPRVKERKKPGLKRARRAPQFSKR